MLPAIAVKTQRIELVTGVTCPSVRYHPAIIAQAAATLAIISDGRFTLGAEAGKQLNEHVVGTGLPARRVRHEQFREALEIIRLLWKGGYRYLRREAPAARGRPRVRPPGEPQVIAVAASGPESARIAAELGDGLFATEPNAELVDTWRRLGGHGPAYTEIPLAWAQDEDAAVAAVLEKSSFALTGWKVMAELPNPVNFEAATASIGPEQAQEQFACGPATSSGTCRSPSSSSTRASTIWSP